MRNPTYYHGSAGPFDRPDPSRFKEIGSYGPGYYLTNDRQLAKSYSIEKIAEKLGVKPSKVKAAPYIRMVDMPDDFHLFDIGENISASDLEGLFSALHITQEEREREDYRYGRAALKPGVWANAVYDTLVEILKRRGEERPKVKIAAALDHMGYQGVTSSGGFIVMVFLSEMHKLRNVETGEYEANPARRRGAR